MIVKLRNSFKPRNQTVEQAVVIIKKRIRDIRLEESLTMRECASQLGITERSYSDKENPLKSVEFKLSEIIGLSKIIELSPGLIVADYWNPKAIGKIHIIIDALIALHPDTKYLADVFSQAEASKEDAKARPVSISLAD